MSSLKVTVAITRGGEGMKLRRFRMKGKNDPDEFFAWCARKGLSREDLVLILASVELDTSVMIMPRRGGAQQP